MPHRSHPAPHRFTAAEILAFPSDGNRYEVVHGELLVTPGPLPRHQAVVTRLMTRLSAYLEPLGRLDTLYSGPADISWDDETLVQPDILVVTPGEVSNDWRTYRSLLLAVEVLSPSSARGDRTVKRRLYQEHEVETYWIVDAEAKSVEVWRPGAAQAEVVTGTLVWRPITHAPALMLEVGELLGALPGEVSTGD